MPDYSDLDPSLLKPSLSDGTKLKKSITTDLYSTGTPSAANQVKRSIMYADGTLKESIANDTALKPSWLLDGAEAPVSTDFITTWTGTTSGTLSMPYTGTGYSGTVTWSDDTGVISTGAFSDGSMGALTSDPLPRTSTVTCTISGTFPRVFFNNNGVDRAKILTVENWGDTGFTSDMTRAFWGCSNLTSIAGSIPPDVEVFREAFYQCTSLSTVDPDTFKFCTSATNFRWTFRDCSNITAVSADLFKHNVAATDMGAVLMSTGLVVAPVDLFRYNILVENLGSVFKDCYSLTTVSEGVFAYNSLVTDLSYAVYRCSNLVSFNSLIKASNITTMNQFATLVTINTTEYNTLLNDIYLQSSTGGGSGVQSGVPFHGGYSVDTTGPPDGIAAVASLTANDSWTITDGT